MGGKIDCYLDCTSFYAYLAVDHLLKNRETLRSYDVDLEFHPVFLGGIYAGSGNQPPWALPAKAKYGILDSDRGKKYFQRTDIRTPDFFPFLSLLPLRAMIYIKDHYTVLKYEAALFSLFSAVWTPPHIDISKAANLRTVLQKNFTATETDEIIAAAGTPEYKRKLIDTTKMIIEEQGAFGCPWYWVKNSEGREEPFFGSDRFHFMWEYLGLPWDDVKLLPKEGDVEQKARL